MFNAEEQSTSKCPLEQLTQQNVV